jgi:hypothetical protein
VLQITSNRKSRIPSSGEMTNDRRKMGSDRCG